MKARVPQAKGPEDLRSQGLAGGGEDVDSKVLRPEFKNPEYPDSDFSLTRPPGLGFETFDPRQAGPRGHDATAPKVLASFPTAPFNPKTDSSERGGVGETRPLPTDVWMWPIASRPDW